METTGMNAGVKERWQRALHEREVYRIGA